MGIYVDYYLRAECHEEELVARLERVRQRCLDLPLRRVHQVYQVDPVYNWMILHIFQARGHALPPAVAERLREAERDPLHRELRSLFTPVAMSGAPPRDLRRNAGAALWLMERTDLWRSADLPEEIREPDPLGRGGFTANRKCVELEFASVLLRYGYVLILDPGEGSETVELALSTFRQPKGRRVRTEPLWLGSGFTKTQYAREFVRVHETVCRVVDILGEEGLLRRGSDNCGYYATRSWKEAGPRVNRELGFARMVSGMLDLAVGNLREEGASVQILEDNASRAQPVDFSAALAREEAAAQCDSQPIGDTDQA